MMNRQQASEPAHWQKIQLTLWLILSIYFLSSAGTRAETGLQAWVQRYHGPGNSDDRAQAVAVDGSGNVFVTGYSQSPGAADYVTIKYSGAGVPLWTNLYNGPANGGDYAFALALDRSGDVFVTGISQGNGTAYDYATIKYSGAGVPLWTNRYNGPSNGVDIAYAVAVDGSGNVFVTGSSAWGGGYSDYATIKYSGAGVPLWTNRYDGPGISDDFASAVAVDGSGNVFVTGQSGGIGDSYDYATIAYSGAGVPLWTNRYEGPGKLGDAATAVAVDGSGNVFVTGSSFGSVSGYDYATIKYSGAGVPLWTNRYDGPVSGSDGTAGRQSLALGPGGSVYVTGSSSGGSGSDFATVKYISVPLLAIERDGSGGLFVHIQGVPEAAYILQRAAMVTGMWSDIATNNVPASGVIEYHDTSPLPGQVFYRVAER